MTRRGRAAGPDRSGPPGPDGSGAALSEPHRRERWLWLALTAILLLAATLRIAVASLSPVIDRVAADVELPALAVGFIGAAAPIAFGVFGFVAPLLARRITLERLALAVVVVGGLGLAARALVVDAVGLLAATLVAFAALGVGNVVLPGLVKKYFPRHVGALTAAYISTMSIATIVPPLVAVPLADAAGWRVALGVWSLVALAAVGPWTALVVTAGRGPDAAATEAHPRVLRRLLTLPRTWGLILAFVVTSGTAYGMFAWLPSLLRGQAGLDAPAAGVLLAVFAGMGLPFSLVLPLVVARWGLVRTLFVVAIVPGLVGVAGLLLAASAAPLLWVVLLSLPTSLFPVVITLVGVGTRTHPTTVALSGIVQSFAYGIAAIVPFGIGALHEATGGWTAPLVLVGAMIASGALAIAPSARPGTAEGDWEARTGRGWEG